MVDTTLTKEMIESGAALARKLDEGGIRPEAVLWLYFADRQRWKLLVAHRDVAKKGSRGIYRKIQKILAESSSETGELRLEDVTIASPNEQIVTLLRRAITTGPGLNGIRFKNNVIYGTLIEDAYIYRLTRSRAA